MQHIKLPGRIVKLSQSILNLMLPIEITLKIDYRKIDFCLVDTQVRRNDYFLSVVQRYLGSCIENSLA